jgi:tRNA (guanine-N(7)-)-methyltransferase subunit TRM82
MKQLLDSSGLYLIGGWNDRAFAGRLDSSVVFELLAPPLPANDNDSKQLSEENSENVKAADIQAVSVLEVKDDDRVWFAVARFDKSLCLYSIHKTSSLKGGEGNTQASNTADSQATTTISPNCNSIYKTAKRVTSLCFATIPADDDNTTLKGEASRNKDLTVLIAADLAGDAVAFALERAPTGRSNNYTSSGEKGEDENDASFRRLLLGHTASMLTAVRVVQNQTTGQQHIITCDRDEKIRVSAFPKTHIIEGFLLGHKAFVSCVDFAKDQTTSKCVSCGGDGTVRLWDYTTMEELDKVVIENSDKTASLISNVSMNRSGDTVIVSVDEQPNVYILKWKNEGDSRASLAGKVSSESLGIVLSTVWVDSETIVTLAREPHYLQVNRVSNNGSLLPQRERFPFVITMNTIARQAAFVLIKSLFERDENGVLKMQKQEENRLQDAERPWNNASRIEKMKAREQRYRKRKRNKKDCDDGPSRSQSPNPQSADGGKQVDGDYEKSC